MSLQKKCQKCSYDVLETWLYCPMCSNSLLQSYPTYPTYQYHNNNEYMMNYNYQPQPQQYQQQQSSYIPIQLQFSKPLLNSDGTESESLYKLIDSIFNYFDYDNQGILTYQKIINYMQYIKEPVKSKDELSVALEATGCELDQDGLTRKGFHQYQTYFLTTDSSKWQKEMKIYFNYDISNILLPAPLTPEQKANEEKRIIERAQQILNTKMATVNAVNRNALNAVDMVRKAAAPPGTYYYTYYG